MSTTTAVTTFARPRFEIARHARGAYRAMSDLDSAIELDSSLRDLVSLRASILNACGESAQRLNAVAAWHEAPFFTERERAALELTDAVTLLSDGHVPRDVFDAASAQFDDEELAQLIWAITAINAWNRIAVTTRMLPGACQPDGGS